MGNARVFVDDIYKQTKVTTKVTAISSRKLKVADEFQSQRLRVQRGLHR